MWSRTGPFMVAVSLGLGLACGPPGSTAAESEPPPAPAPIEARSEAPATGDRLLVLNKAEATVSVLDPGSARVLQTVAVGEGPHEVAVAPDGALAVATNYGTRERPGTTLSVIDLKADAEPRTLTLEHRRPHGIQFRPNGREVVVTVEDSRAVICVDVLSGTVTCEVETNQDVSHMVVLSPDGSRAYVANIGSGSLSVVDLNRKQLLETIPTGAGAEGVDITPDGTEVWVTNREANTVSVIDTSALAVVATLPSDAFPIRARMTPDGRHCLVSNARSGVVRVFDVAARKEVQVVSFDQSGEGEGRLFGDQFGDSSVPIGIVVRPDGRRAFVAHTNADVISVIDLTTWKPTGTLRAGREPDGMGFVPAQ